jgi:hypothetical protein
MNFKATSRVDDMISLAYLMFYLINDSELPGLNSYIEHFVKKEDDI